MSEHEHKFRIIDTDPEYGSTSKTVTIDGKRYRQTSSNSYTGNFIIEFECLYCDKNFIKKIYVGGMQDE